MEDSYLWLEDRLGSRAIDWAQMQSNITKNIFENDPRFQKSSKEILDILVAKDKIPAVSLFEGYAYNLWQDENHKRGLWRRATTQEYKNSNPTWEVLIDFDELAQKEAQPWVFSGCTRLPGYDHCLVHLSKNNQDAREIREFSLSKKEFIKDGFFIPESKSQCDWYDENHLLVNLALTADQKTNSGYSRQAFYWTRGEALASAQLLYDGKKDDVSIWATTARDQGRHFGVINRYVNYDFIETFILSSDLKLQKLQIPNDANLLAVHQGRFFLSARSEWRGFPAGSVLAIPQSMGGDADIASEKIEMLFQPNKKSAFVSLTHTRDRVYLAVNENVCSQIYEARFGARDGWQLDKIFNSENSFYISTIDKFTDTAIFQEEGYLQPRRFMMREGATISEIKKTQSHFKEASYLTEQFWVKSKDEVEIPYTVVRAKNLAYEGTNPTLLYGYGGFAISRTPVYNPVMGKVWLEKGGVFVMANIRGGGEFGAEWHKAAMKENKQKSYDDFIAIAEDLIARKITSPQYLGIQGGSNGGLLVGAVAMQRPELLNAVVCQIPLLDMIRYTKLPPGASWVGEYGEPDDLKFHEIIMKYSPYQNISKNKIYPKFFFQTTQADDRVHPGHARKMAARMKEYGHDVLFYEAADGGHGIGGVDLEDQARVSAYVFIYLYQQLLKCTEPEN